ncbi:MAG: tetratricopeptide repeat protein [Archangium sp.]|nr:tetratricopeptide repeat protein [Archangium sp.]
MRPALVLALFLFGCPIVVPQAAQDYNGLCAQFLVANDLAQADAACDHALEYQPKYWDALHNKGMIAQARGDKKKAKQFYIEALRANQHMKSSLNSLGAMSMEEGDLKTAAEQFKAALVIEPAYLEARRNLGAVHLQQKQFADAVKDFRQLLLVDPNLVEGHLGLASGLMGQQQFDEACPVLERATTLNVDDDRAWLMRGACEQARGRQAEAKDAFERCLLANEKNLECQQALKVLTSD